jgi:hypothetical protein
MMHNVYDLQCLNACVTPGCYSWDQGDSRLGAGAISAPRRRQDKTARR